MNDSYLLPVFLKALEELRASEEQIKNYKTFYLSSKHPDGLPCPVCFVFKNKCSRLIALPGDDKGSSIKCTVCQEEFYVEMP
jgi:hypothetical protein